jgi:hypothetical protein
MNSDGFLDIVGYGSAVGTVWLGDGTGNWTQAAGFTTPTYGDYEALRAGGDVDHNGNPDIILVDDEGTYPSDINVAHCFRETSSPETLRILPVFPRGGEQFYPGSVQFIDWTCAVAPPETVFVHLDYSTTGPTGPWNLIADALKNSGRFQWAVPNSPSTNCYLRLTASTSSYWSIAYTPRPFTILTSLGISRKPQAANRKRLDLQVYPNPATDVMTVRYTIASSGPATINLYDITGKLVGTLTGGYRRAGTYACRLSSATGRLSAGVYVLKLESRGSCIVRKLILD